MTCPDCGAPTTTRPLPESAMQVDDVVVAVRGLGLATCEAGHHHVVPADVATAAADEVGARLLHATRSGVLRRRDVCGACGAELVLPPRTTDTPVPFALGPAVVTVVVDAPMARCPACGQEQLPPEVGARVDDALAAAVAAAADGA